MGEEKLDLIINELSDIKIESSEMRKELSEIKIDSSNIKKELSEIKDETKRGSDSLKIIDRRLSLIEQRLSNIEPWISVDNSHLKYTHRSGESISA